MPSSNHSLLDKLNLTLTRLSPGSDLKQFDCGDSDLNEFFHKDAADYGRQLLAVTYVFENNSEIVAFFSVLNDKIVYEDVSGSKFAPCHYPAPTGSLFGLKNRLFCFIKTWYLLSIL